MDIVNSPALQRLKGIDQAGYFEPFFPGSSLTRFEHSVGVYLLLNEFNAPIEEQIAGLIHDVSHSAFSHCIDYALDEGSEKTHSHQDDIFAEYVLKSEIPQILEKYGYDVNHILDEKNFPLKEKDLPDLCADRIDYTLRNALLFKVKDNIDNINDILENLTIYENKWVFKNFEHAKSFAMLFKKLNDKYYSGIESATMFRTVGDYLKYSLSKGYIDRNDLYTNDKFVLEKVNSNLEKDEQLKILWNRMNNRISAKNNPDDYDAIVYCKSRVVDPLIILGGKLIRVSEIDLEWEKIVLTGSEPKKYFLKFDE